MMRITKAKDTSPTFAVEASVDSDGSSRISLSGRVSYANLEGVRAKILAELTSGGAKEKAEETAARRESAGEVPEGAPRSRLTLDLDRVESEDSSTVALVLALRENCRDRGIDLRLGRFDRTGSALASLVDLDRVAAPLPAHGRQIDGVTAVGEMALRQTTELAAMVRFVGRLTLGLGRGLRRPGKIRWAEVALFVQRTGVDALPIVGLMSLLVGLVTAFSSAIQLRQFGANIFIANLIGIGMTREMGPLLAAILLTGRSGSAFAAEIGTMKISEEIDALTVMGVRTTDYLILPRVLAVMVTLPLLALFADLCGILGGMIIAIAKLDLTPLSFMEQLRKSIGLWDVFSGLLKAFVFGILVAGTGCFRGEITRGGASGVGQSTTRAVVNGIFLIVLADSIFVVVFNALGLG